MRPLLISLLCLLQLACASTVISRGENKGLGRPSVLTHHLFFWGWWESSRPIAISEICGLNNWSRIHSEYAPLDIVVGVATLGLYTPVTVKVYCSTLQSRR